MQVVPGLLVAKLDDPRQPADRFGLRDPDLGLRELEILQRVLQLVAALLDGALQALNELAILQLAAPAVQGVGDVDQQLADPSGLTR